jgi:hypothetical protein
LATKKAPVRLVLIAKFQSFKEYFSNSGKEIFFNVEKLDVNPTL